MLPPGGQDMEGFKIWKLSRYSQEALAKNLPVVFPVRGCGIYTYRCNILLLFKVPNRSSHEFSQEPLLFLFP